MPGIIVIYLLGTNQDDKKKKNDLRLGARD